jgi:cobalt transporter subunit CbtB
MIEAPAIAAAPARSETLVAAIVSFVFGLCLVYTTGFSHPMTIHNAAHDTRHALSFPCH